MMNRYILIVAVVMVVAGCTSARISRNLSSGAIGCAPEDIEIVNETATVIGSMHNFEAICKGKRFFCSYQPTTGINCKEAIQTEEDQLINEDNKAIEESISKPVEKNKQPLLPPAKETTRDDRFIAYNDGTVIDTRTNLMWAENDNGSDIKWRDARSFCKKYRGGGYTDWRMPTQDELAGLYDARKKNRYGARVTDLIKLTSWWVWASEKRGSEASVFLFNDGQRYSLLLWEGNSVRVLPVRSIK